MLRKIGESRSLASLGDGLFCLDRSRIGMVSRMRIYISIMLRGEGMLWHMAVLYRNVVLYSGRRVSVWADVGISARLQRCDWLSMRWTANRLGARCTAGAHGLRGNRHTGHGVGEWLHALALALLSAMR